MTGHRAFWAVALAGVAVAALVWRQQAGRDPAPPTAGEPPVVREFFLFGTGCRVTLYGNAKTCEAALDEMQSRLQAVHDTVNNYDPDSELSHLNETAFDEPVVCSELLWDMLTEARRAHRETDGAFDISVGPLMALWGFHRKQDRFPAPDAVATALDSVGLDKVQFDDAARTVRFTHPETRLDFGGMAKGYGCDLARLVAERHGLRQGVIDLGGNTCVLAHAPPGRDAYRIGVRHPIRTEDLLETVPLRDACVATSGNYENYRVIEGRTVTHIVDPRTGRPVENRLSVSVRTPRGIHSDVFSTAVFVGGRELAERLAAAHPGTGFLIAATGEGEEEMRIVRVNWPAPHE